jgi:hypothetical protein
MTASLVTGWDNAAITPQVRGAGHDRIVIERADCDMCMAAPGQFLSFLCLA